MVRDSLVVGINQYQDDKLHNLKTPVLDAEAIAQILEQYGGFNVLRLPKTTNAQITDFNITKKQKVNLADLKNALSKLFIPQKQPIPDTVLFYFSGHGLIQHKDIQESFLATSDVDTNLGFHGLSLTWLHNLLEKSPIKQQIIWLDCCHEKEIFNFHEYDPSELGKARDICFISASRVANSSYEDVEINSSILTKILLNGLNPDRCPQKWITNYNLIEFINQNLHNKTQRVLLTNLGEPINLTCTLENKNCAFKQHNNNHIMLDDKLDYVEIHNTNPNIKVQDFNQYVLTNKPNPKSNNNLLEKFADEPIIVPENPEESNSKNFQPVKFAASKSIQEQKKEVIKSLSLFIIISLIGTAIGAYFVLRDIRLDSDNQVILNCVAKKNCSQNLEALENIVKAKRSLESYNFNNADLRYANLESANLKYATLYNTDLKYINLKYASLLGADLRYADLENANLRYANLANTDLRYTTLHHTDLSYTDLRYTDLRYTDLKYTNLRYTDLRYTDLRYANLENADLRYTNLENADLRYANLENADLRYTNLENTNLESANLKNANLIQSKSLNPSQIKIACNWQKAMYIGNYNPKTKQWIVEKEANQQYIEQLKQDKASDPKETIDCIKVD